MSRIACPQCHGYLTTFAEFMPEEDHSGYVEHNYAYYCDDPKCPNYKLITVGEEVKDDK